jgi:hypothetical protein
MCYQKGTRKSGLFECKKCGEENASDDWEKLPIRTCPEPSLVYTGIQ